MRNRDGSTWRSGVTIANTIVWVPDRAGNEPSDASAHAISGLSEKVWEEVCSSSESTVSNLRFPLLPVYI